MIKNHISLYEINMRIKVISSIIDEFLVQDLLAIDIK